MLFRSREEITRIGNTTQFNKKKLLDGSAAVLWSSDNLNIKAIVNGGLRQVDQFGQKKALEGNYKIDIKAEAGQGEIKKSDIFKVKHKDVVSVSSKAAFISEITGKNLTAGEDYNITGAAKAAVATEVVKKTNTDWDDDFITGDFIAAGKGNAQLLVEVIGKSDGRTGKEASQIGRAHVDRSEEHTSELQSQIHLVCRLLLEKKKKKHLIE